MKWIQDYKRTAIYGPLRSTIYSKNPSHEGQESKLVCKPHQLWDQFDLELIATKSTNSAQIKLPLTNNNLNFDTKKGSTGKHKGLREV